MRKRGEAGVYGLRAHVIGLGAYGTGRAVARMLWQRGAQVVVSDTKPAEELAPEIAALEDTSVVVLTGEEAYQGIEEADLVVPSPGVPLDIPPLVRARECGARVVSEIEVAFWICPCEIIAVTGTKGKTTTTALIAELIRGEGRSVLVGGNIGRPLVAVADKATPEDVIVAEVSSFQLEAIEEFRSRVAVLLNLFADHLDRHGSMASYREAKARVFANQCEEDAAVINRDDGEAWALRERTAAKVIPFTLQGVEPEGADMSEGYLRVKGEPVASVSSVRLKGKHNLANVLAALAAADAAGAALNRVEETLEGFAGIEHRLEVAGLVGGVVFINDSQATTPAAAMAALEAFDKRPVLIAGGRAKTHDFDGLGEALARHGGSLIVMGEAAEEIAGAAGGAGVQDIMRAKDLGEAVELAHSRARAGEVVLLSPACASFDMFSNMAERGDSFKALVRSLTEEREE